MGYVHSKRNLKPPQTSCMVLVLCLTNSRIDQLKNRPTKSPVPGFNPGTGELKF